MYIGFTYAPIDRAFLPFFRYFAIWMSAAAGPGERNGSEVDRKWIGSVPGSARLGTFLYPTWFGTVRHSSARFGHPPPSQALPLKDQTLLNISGVFYHAHTCPRGQMILLLFDTVDDVEPIDDRHPSIHTVFLEVPRPCP